MPRVKKYGPNEQKVDITPEAAYWLTKNFQKLKQDLAAKTAECAGWEETAMRHKDTIRGYVSQIKDLEGQVLLLNGIASSLAAAIPELAERLPHVKG